MATLLSDMNETFVTNKSAELDTITQDENINMIENSLSRGNVESCPSNTINESEEEGLEYDGELPLEVITTVSKEINGPIIKLKSNGVLTHRNIFTDTERAVLKDIVVNYQEIVDTRSRSRETFLEKQQAWEKIVLDYNDRPGMQPRSVKELRKCWDNMKYRARQAEKEFQQKSLLQEQGYLHMLSFGDVSITKDGLDMVNSTRDIESPVPIGNTTELLTTSADDDAISEELQAVSEGSSDNEPAIKKARLNAPKLSSLLLASAWNNTQFDVAASESATIDPIVNVKDEPDYNISSSTSTKVKNINLDYSNRSSVEVDRTQNKNLTTFHLGSGMTITSQCTTPPNLDKMQTQPNIRPMPALKKMGARIKYEESVPKKLKTSKKIHSSSSISSSIEPELFPMSFSNENNSPVCREVYKKLLNNRVEQEELEHRLRMKALEKQLHAYSQQTSYWSLKLKLLKSGKDNSNSIVNGDQVH